MENLKFSKFWLKLIFFLKKTKKNLKILRELKLTRAAGRISNSIRVHFNTTIWNEFRMSKNDLEFVTRDLNSGKLRSDQVEKNLEKWMNKMINHLLTGTLPGRAIIAFMRSLLVSIVQHNLHRAMSAHCVHWMTDILRDVSNTQNPTTHLSLIALILRYVDETLLKQFR